MAVAWRQALRVAGLGGASAQCAALGAAAAAKQWELVLQLLPRADAKHGLLPALGVLGWRYALQLEGHPGAAALVAKAMEKQHRHHELRKERFELVVSSC